MQQPIPPNAPTAQTDQVFLTALPNGSIDVNNVQMLRLSLLITPSLVTTPLVAPFRHWPDYARNLSFSATFSDTAGNILSGPTPLTLDPHSLTPPRGKSLWDEIFNATSHVKQRTGHSKFHRSWRISHDITNLSNRNQLNRLAHVYSQVTASQRMVGPNLPSLKQQTTAPPLFLHADFTTNASSPLPDRIDDRVTALSALNTITGGLTSSTTKRINYRKIVGDRFNYGIAKLENWGGAHLTAAALSALYLSCVNSAAAIGVSDPTLAAAAATVNSWFVQNANEFKAPYPEFPDIPQYLDLVLFHRRSMTAKKPGTIIDPPDFHQLLGMVHNYPAIMRQLNLAYDFVLPNPHIDGSNVVSIALNPAQATLPGQGIPNPVTVVSCKTRYTLQGSNFFATPTPTTPPTAPKDVLIQNGLLNLQAPGAKSNRRFTLVPENADGQALKNTGQTNNQARGQRYTTSAPTAYSAATVQDETPGSIVPTPSATANPVTAPTAPRTVGLALFDRDHLLGLMQQAAKVPDGDNPPGAPPTDFFAEDLILGYRVDVLFKNKFYSLCERTSTYNIFLPFQPVDSDHPVDTWAPSTDMEKSADEGFTSFGATQSPISDNTGSVDDPTDTITQVHQSMFTWSGWSLSVPAPNFSSMNRTAPPANPATPPPAPDPQNNILAIRPQYGVVPHQLPPLRFNGDYTIRCRIVDLVGNGPTPDLDPDNSLYKSLTLAPFVPFSRHEPIRAPQFLLRHPIDRKKEPGTHIDRMVARDDQEPSIRMLVPPRESLRLAELTNFATAKLPDSAFGNLCLEKDGAFPTVANAKDQGWIPGTSQVPNDNDGIFLPGPPPHNLQNRYYPDPLANFIRIQPFIVTADPAWALACNPIWLKITADGEAWPQRLPVRVLLIPIGENVPPRFEADSDAFGEDEFSSTPTPTFKVFLPPANTVVLRISSASVNGKGEGDGKNQPVFLTHMLVRHRKDPSAFDTLLPMSQQSGIASSAGAILVDAGVNVATVINPNVIINGSTDVGTPKRSLTLVHAVKKPLAPPSFDSQGITVIRPVGKPEASVQGNVFAHWLSTAKLTCYAQWSDQVDDLTLPAERIPPKLHQEVAFAVTAKDLTLVPNEPTLRALSGIDHHFTDTRAHTVTYSLSAATSFREYYPEATEQPDKKAAEYQIDGEHTLERTVFSSARPLAPSLVYLIPAFIWEDTFDRDKKVWYKHRTVVLRAYFQRPFLLSGDQETVAVVLVDPTSATQPGNQKFVSRWGADPTRPITAPIQQNELTDANFNEPGNPIQQAFLAEAAASSGTTARFKPCNIQYSQARQLWFADIPIDIQNANSPFVRLALVRWQPQSLSGDAASECRCSQVVVAEFMQVSADRWVSLQKKDGSHFCLAVSGPFPANSGSGPCPFTLTLQKRWYPLTHDTGWRTVSWKHNIPPVFNFNPDTDQSGVSNFSTEFHTPHSAYVAKYRVLLTESETPDQNTRKPFSMFLDLP